MLGGSADARGAVAVSAADEPEAGRPVSGLVSPMIRRLAALLALAVAICLVGVLASSRAVDTLTDDLGPAYRTHDRFAEAAGAVQDAAAAWAITGEERYAADLVDARGDLTEATVGLRALGADDAELEAVVASELAATRAWLRSYVAPVAGAAGGPVPFDADLFAVGEERWATLARAGDATEATLGREFRQSGDSASIRFDLTIVGALLVLVASWVVIARARARLLDDLSTPLLGLERIVQRMLRHDPDGRAAADLGPKEVRAIARALNDLAEAQSRARAVEGRIQDELRVLDGAKDDFVSNVSHELRTPLTTIGGYLELVAEEFEGKLDPRHDRMLAATRRNVARLGTLVDDLLALSRAESRPGAVEPVDVLGLLTEAVTDVRMTAARRGIVVEIAAPDHPMLVVGDRTMLYRVFLNLLANAVKFSHSGGAVEVTVRPVGDRVQIAIRDHGIGIPPTEIDRLGTRFFRASNAMSNEIAGTGLGLRIVQTIIDQHEGDVVIESAEGEGTTVLVRLRRHRPPDDGAGIGTADPVFSTMSAGPGSRRAPHDDPGHIERTP